MKRIHIIIRLNSITSCDPSSTQIEFEQDFCLNVKVFPLINNYKGG